MHFYLTVPLLILALGGTFVPAMAATRLIDKSTDQRVAHFEDLLRSRARTKDSPEAPQARGIVEWRNEHRPMYDKTPLDDFLDLYLRRHGMFKPAEAFAYLTERLVEAWSAPVTSAQVLNVAAVKLYTDAAMIMSANPIPPHFLRASRRKPSWKKVNAALDAIAYQRWSNPELKALIERVAERVPGTPEGKAERVRWFFAPYYKKTCAINMDRVAKAQRTK